MTPKKVFKPGDMVTCRCPDGVCKLPDGLPKNASAEVSIAATYLSRTYVKYYEKIYLVENECLYKEIK